ncbi:cytochrome b561 [Pantoea cypripedii]|uniref:Cytochrome b n=1 Tax=Pantoea cypripedii TaxID=55209 RepID=A0A1X1EGD6_PANCY|nr:cytochrome b561 [Pantoea cypripedii]MBP2199710.1 cytochrome b561 [Pantoea cypripedii]ORM88018.1 cytochrome b [Pantoea cypripedii]
MQNKFAPSQILLHWLTFFLVVIAYCTMEFRGLATRGSWQGFAMIIGHFSTGSCVLVLMLSRVLLRLRHRSPAIVPKPEGWQTGLAHLMHLGLYLFFIALPILGILSRFYLGRTWWLFGIPMPVSAAPDPDFADILTGLHKTLAPYGYWLVGIHAVAALTHHYLMKDNTLLRMMPSRRSR